jgi:hypothetical protein
MDRLKSIAGSALMLPALAFAAVPPDVTAELATGKSDMQTVAYTVVGIVIALFAIKLIRRAL